VGVNNFRSPSPSSPPARAGEMFGVFSKEGRIHLLFSLNNSISLDARFRGHDELRHSPLAEGGKRRGITWIFLVSRVTRRS
jgi:hypothetical protein